VGRRLGRRGEVGTSEVWWIGRQCARLHGRGGKVALNARVGPALPSPHAARTAPCTRCAAAETSNTPTRPRERYRCKVSRYRRTP